MPDGKKGEQAWVEKTKDLLQFKMESGLRTGEWDESTPENLKKKAYDSHSDAYLEAGLADLPQEDIDTILTAVDKKDFLTLDALLEAGQTAWDMPVEKKGKSFLTTIQWLLSPSKQQ